MDEEVSAQWSRLLFQDSPKKQMLHNSFCLDYPSYPKHGLLVVLIILYLNEESEAVVNYFHRFITVREFKRRLSPPSVNGLHCDDQLTTLQD